jgi:hypothetical protein
LLDHATGPYSFMSVAEFYDMLVRVVERAHTALA